MGNSPGTVSDAIIASKPDSYIVRLSTGERELTRAEVWGAIGEGVDRFKDVGESDRWRIHRACYVKNPNAHIFLRQIGEGADPAIRLTLRAASNKRQQKALRKSCMRRVSKKGIELWMRGDLCSRR